MSVQPEGQAIPIVIYQMGKVGSTALAKALKPLVSEVYQVHTLEAGRLDRACKTLNASGLGIPGHLQHSKYLREQFILPPKPLRFISLIRSPLERNISAFFQELSSAVVLDDNLRKQLKLPEWMRQVTRLPIPNEWKNALMERLIQNKLDKNLNTLIDYYLENFRHRFPLDWLDFELKEAIGIDVFEEPFDVQTGYHVYQREQFQLLLLKTELPNTDKSKIVGNFLQLEEPLDLQSIHQSSRKVYGSLMKRFKETVGSHAELVSTMRESKYVRTFYPEMLGV